MNNLISRQFADSILALIPDFPMSADEIQAAINTQGVDGFMSNSDSSVAELVEAAELLLRMEAGAGI